MRQRSRWIGLGAGLSGLTLVVGSVAAVPAGASAKPKNAAAHQDLLRLSDLPTGWKVTKTTSTSSTSTASTNDFTEVASCEGTSASGLGANVPSAAGELHRPADRPVRLRARRRLPVDEHGQPDLRLLLERQGANVRRPAAGQVDRFRRDRRRPHGVEDHDVPPAVPPGRIGDDRVEARDPADRRRREPPDERRLHRHPQREEDRRPGPRRPVDGALDDLRVLTRQEGRRPAQLRGRRTRRLRRPLSAILTFYTK